MYDDRCSPEFINGVRTFLLAAEANKRADGFMHCPCAGCKNGRNYSTSRTIHVHLFKSGFMPHYNAWTKHGERGVMMEDNEEEEYDEDFLNESRCCICGSGRDEGSILICDKCGVNMSHFYCDRLKAIPTGKWYCRECRQILKEEKKLRRKIGREFTN